MHRLKKTLTTYLLYGSFDFNHLVNWKQNEFTELFAALGVTLSNHTSTLMRLSYFHQLHHTKPYESYLQTLRHII